MKLKFGETEVEVNLFLFIWTALKRKLRLLLYKPKIPTKTRVILSFLFAFLLLGGIGYSLYQFSQIQRWSPEVNAAVINLYVSTLTFIIMISVTVYFNVQTQKITMETQKMNYNAIRFQARAPIRDEILKERMRIYPKMRDDLIKIHDPALKYFHVKDVGIFTNISTSEAQKIMQTNKQIIQRLGDYLENPFISKDVRKLLQQYIEWRKFGKYPDFLSDEKNITSSFINSTAYVLSEGVLFDFLLSLLVSELQLEEVEEDIESLKKNKKTYWIHNIDRMP